MVFCWKRWSVISVVKKLSHVCGSCLIRPSNMFSSGILAPRTLCFSKFSVFFEQLYSGKYYQTTIIKLLMNVFTRKILTSITPSLAVKDLPQSPDILVSIVPAL